VLIACVVVLGQGCVWYSGQFWALYFLQTVKKIDVLTSSYIVGLALLIATPTLIFWGWLSDKIGRKPIILGGMLLASLTYYPLYIALSHYADPNHMNYTMSVLIVVVLVNYVGMTYGPIAAFLAEFFPGRIRYTSVSVPYHIGNGWGGGLVPDRSLRHAGDSPAQHLGGRGDRGNAGVSARFVSGVRLRHWCVSSNRDFVSTGRQAAGPGVQRDDDNRGSLSSDW
jgi:hypothetical protein